MVHDLKNSYVDTEQRAWHRRAQCRAFDYVEVKVNNRIQKSIEHTKQMQLAANFALCLAVLVYCLLA